MNFLTQNLILSAFVSAQDSKTSFLTNINVATDPNADLNSFKALVLQHCTDQHDSSTIANYEDVLKKIKWAKTADAGQKIKMEDELAKEVNCQNNLAVLYFNELTKLPTSGNLEITITGGAKIGSYTQKLVDTENDKVKEAVSQKLVTWFGTQFDLARSASASTALVTQSFEPLFEGSNLETLYKPVFKEVMKVQKNKLSKDILDAIFKKTSLVARPKTDLVVLVDVAVGTDLKKVYDDANDYTMVLLQEFTKILEAADKSAYDGAIAAAKNAFATKFSHLDVNWINALLASMKSAHVKLINSDDLTTAYLVEHRTKIATGVEGQHYLSQVLIAAKTAPRSGDTSKLVKFVNKASKLQFTKRRDDFLYNTYMDLKLKNETNEEALNKKKEAAFYVPSKWTSLNLALLKDSNPDKEFVFVGDENYHEDQKVKYGSGIINIPVEFDITTFKPASTSAAASAGTTSEAAFKHFNTVMDNLRENTCINFFRVTEESHLEKLKNADRQYIKLARALPTERGCDEIIGKKPIKGKADIPTLQPFSEPCLKGNNKTKLPTGIAHYFMHHLGFDNEHQRHDADTFVKHPEDRDLPMMNSRPGHNTKYDEGNNASSLTGEYDIKSVMQWSQKWTKSQKGVTPPSHMRAGEVSLFSTKDFAKINNLYGCGSKSLEEKTDCDELITQSTKERAIDYNGRVKKCLEKKSAKANIYFQQPEFRKISSTTISAYKIKATVIYKTIIKKKNRRLAKVWSSNMEIASGDAALYTNRSGGICGGARINIESNENSFICSIQGNESEQSKLIVSKCGEPMKVQYEVIGDNVDENAITSVLKIEGVDYVTCDTDVIGLVGKDSSSGSIFKLFTLVTIFLI